MPLTEAHREQVRAVCDRIEFVEPTRHGLFIPMTPDVDIAFGWPILEDVLASSTLRWLQLRGAGSDAYRHSEALRRKKLLITTAHGVFDIAGAEHVLGMMLYFARALGPSFDQQRRHVWDLAAIRPLMGELHGQTVAVFGLGGFGREIARRAKAFGMRVLGVRRTPGQAVECVDELFTIAEVRKVVAQSDHVVLALPATPETRGLFDAGLIAVMKPTACLYNIARGSLMDEGALLAALRSRRIAGAGLDVFDKEPLPNDSPFWELPNVLITPHSAGRSPREFDRMLDLFCDNLGRYLKGQPLRNELDFEKGY